MSEATNRMDLNMFAKAVNLNPSQAIADIQELAREGFLHKLNGGFGLTEKGKNCIKIFGLIQNNMVFYFYADVDRPLDFSAQSLEEFYGQIKQVISESIEFHLYRGDFENWLREALQDSELAEDFGTLKNKGLKGEDLRKAVLKTIDDKYEIGKLL